LAAASTVASPPAEVPIGEPADRSAGELLREFHDRVAVAPEIHHVGQVRNDCGHARFGQRAAQVAMTDARAREAVRNDREALGWPRGRTVDIDVLLVAGNLDRYGLAHGRQRCRRSRRQRQRHQEQYDGSVFRHRSFQRAMA